MRFVPWWAKICGKLVLARLPFGYRLWQSFGLFRHGSMDTLAYVKLVFDKHVDAVGLTGSLKGKTVLELGPGDSVATALIAACYGARAILVDAGPFAVTDISIYKRMASDLEKIGLSPPKEIYGAQSIEELLSACNSIYLVRGLESISEIFSCSVDFIFSQAVLEHVRKKDFLQTAIEMRRIIKPDGVASHRIDLRDHLGGGLNNLRFKESVWESSLFVGSGFYTNRIQCNKMLADFRCAGFETVVRNTSRWTSLPIGRDALDDEFRGVPDDELLVSGFDVVLHPRIA